MKEKMLKKNKPARYRHQNESGIILLVSLWILVILTILAVGLGRRTGMEITMTKYQISQLKADYLALAGLSFARQQIKIDSGDENTKNFDTLFQCAVRLSNGASPESLFKEVRLGDGYFDVGYLEDNDSAKEYRHGLRDEGRRINLNAVTATNKSYNILYHLIILLGENEDAAMTIASSVVDWHDLDSDVTNPPYGAEDDDYQASPKPYKCKNAIFESVEELQLVKGVTAQIFDELKKYVTVFPQEDDQLTVNPDTAPEIILKSLGYMVAGAATNTEAADADSLVAKLIEYRSGADGSEFTADDRHIDLTGGLSELGLNAKEEAIFNASRARFKSISNYVRVRVKGVEERSGAKSHIEAVIDRQDPNLYAVAWYKN